MVTIKWDEKTAYNAIENCRANQVFMDNFMTVIFILNLFQQTDQEHHWETSCAFPQG